MRSAWFYLDLENGPDFEMSLRLLFKDNEIQWNKIKKYVYSVLFFVKQLFSAVLMVL